MLANLFCEHFLKNLHSCACNYKEILVLFKQRNIAVWCEEIIPRWQDCFQVSVGPARLWDAVKTAAISKRSRIFCDETEEEARHPGGSSSGCKGELSMWSEEASTSSITRTRTDLPALRTDAFTLRNLCVQFPRADVAVHPPGPQSHDVNWDATWIPMCRFPLMGKKWAYNPFW